MFSKRWLKLIILLFLGTLIPLVMDSFVFNLYEGAMAQGGSDLGGVGMKKAIATAAEQAKKAATAAVAKSDDEEKKVQDELAAATKELAEATKAANAAEADVKATAAKLGVKESFVEGATAKSGPTAADMKDFNLKKAKSTALKLKLAAIKKKVDEATKKAAAFIAKKGAAKKK